MPVHLTADDVAAITFEPTQFRFGYESAEIDAFLGRVEAALRAGEDLRPILDEANFTVTRFRLGYDQAEVDEFIDSLRHGLRQEPVRRSSHRADPVPGAPLQHVRTVGSAVSASPRTKRPSREAAGPDPARRAEPSRSTPDPQAPTAEEIEAAATSPAAEDLMELAPAMFSSEQPDDHGAEFEPAEPEPAEPEPAEPEPLSDGGAQSSPVPDDLGEYAFDEAEQALPVAGPTPVTEPASTVADPAPDQSAPLPPPPDEPVPSVVVDPALPPSGSPITEPPAGESEPLAPAAPAAEQPAAPAAERRFATATTHRDGHEIVTVGGYTADDIDAVQFHVTRRREPYDMTAVDDFIDALAAAARNNDDPTGLLDRLPFPGASRSGYRRREVDSFVDRLLGEE